MCGTPPGPGWKSGYFTNATAQPDDIAYTRTSLDMIKKAVHVRPGHVFAMGHSNGAMMSESHNNNTLLTPNTSPHTTAHSPRALCSLRLLLAALC